MERVSKNAFTQGKRGRGEYTYRIHRFLRTEPLEGFLSGILMNSGSGHILEEPFNIFVIGVGSTVLVSRATVPTRIAPAILGWWLRGKASTRTVGWIFGRPCARLHGWVGGMDVEKQT